MTVFFSHLSNSAQGIARSASEEEAASKKLPELEALYRE